MTSSVAQTKCASLKRQAPQQVQVDHTGFGDTSKKAKNPKEAEQVQDINMSEELKTEALSTEPTIRQPCKILECPANHEEHFKMECQAKKLCECKQMTPQNLTECQTERAKEPQEVAEQQDNAKAIAQ